MATETTIKYYRLKRPYWDNKVMQPKGAVLPFEEGKAPSTASLLTQAEVDDLAAADKASAAIEVQLPKGFYADVVAEVTAKVLAAIGQKDASEEVSAGKPSSAEGGSTPAETKAKK